MPAIEKIKLVECPRDAMQGIHKFISTADKIEYLNLLLLAGFNTLDFGSFVSPKVVPQMADTAEVLKGLNLTSSATKLLAIVVNAKGIQTALQHPEITYLGYPFSISGVFQKRNTNSDIESSLIAVEDLLQNCALNNKTAVIYLSMAFGNPYGEIWNEELVAYWTEELVKRGTTIIALSDTIGAASPETVGKLHKQLSKSYQDVEFGVHLHSRPDDWETKIDAAYQNGCRRFDSAIRGFGGCPMAADSLTGNIATENLIAFLEKKQENHGLNMHYFEKAMNYFANIFPSA